MVAPALRVVEETRTRVVTPVLGPNGDQVAVALLDFTPMGVRANDLLLDSDLRPFIVNCDDGVILFFSTRNGEHHRISRRAEHCKRGDVLGDIYLDAPHTDVLLEDMLITA